MFHSSKRLYCSNVDEIQLTGYDLEVYKNAEHILGFQRHKQGRLWTWEKPLTARRRVHRRQNEHRSRRPWGLEDTGSTLNSELLEYFTTLNNSESRCSSPQLPTSHTLIPVEPILVTTTTTKITTATTTAQPSRLAAFYRRVCASLAVHRTT
ncbi:hypothetical protein TBLA_0B02300 [Henningerozyma blattae CBS 6284]|uniref:Uncharacterized protein n=1 Tax=Henningerozyma blattae (strain ATCC 34711 / CBS 6284 / DSM 70876 / NBRC 10599 / NRRL Y-10934 / UCD 77-7) TaxID=1071380 RepID=I2GY70_HENB6|nr:hypothetical protein TBLA_0B02300 [Tetrapisispora blattae CBS 6284]CCH59072.1 hypothetical protein TBLA_0B02300 [Tetrapisispora blattae CBS 6284]